MRIIGIVGRVVMHVLVVMAKALGGERGMKTFDQDGYRSSTPPRDDYRP